MKRNYRYLFISMLVLFSTVFVLSTLVQRRASEIDTSVEIEEDEEIENND